MFSTVHALQLCSPWAGARAALSWLGCHPDCQGHWKGRLVPGFLHNIQMRPVTQPSCYQTVRKLGIWLHGSREYVYTVWAHSWRVCFTYFACNLPCMNWSQKEGLDSMLSVLSLNLGLPGIVFFLFWTLKMQSSFGWFMHETRSRITSLTFVYCLRLVVCNIFLHLIVWLTRLARKASTERLGAGISLCPAV